MWYYCSDSVKAFKPLKLSCWSPSFYILCHANDWMECHVNWAICIFPSHHIWIMQIPKAFRRKVVGCSAPKRIPCNWILTSATRQAETNDNKNTEDKQSRNATEYVTFLWWYAWRLCMSHSLSAQWKERTLPGNCAWKWEPAHRPDVELRAWRPYWVRLEGTIWRAQPCSWKKKKKSILSFLEKMQILDFTSWFVLIFEVCPRLKYCPLN